MRLLTEKEVRELQTPLPNGVKLVYFKIVGVGSDSLANTEYNGQKICELIGDQNAYFLVGEADEDFSQSMHELVERFCSKLRG